jgi:hypothetical protein
MATNCFRILLLAFVITAFGLVSAEKATAQVVFAPYGAHRGRIVIRPWVQKIWWGNGLTPYGAATIQHTVTAAENVITNENVQETLSNLISRELDRREAQQRSLNDCQGMLDQARSNRDALARLVGSPDASKKTSSRDVKESESTQPPSVFSAKDAQAYNDYANQFAAIEKSVGTLAEQTQKAIDDGAALRKRIEVIQQEVATKDEQIEEANDRLRELLDGLAPLRKKK